MTLALQLAEHKRKSQAINDFVIEATYLKDLAAQVLYAQGQSLETPAFQEACAILKDLCQTVQASITRLGNFIPPSPVPSQEETRETAKDRPLDDPSFPLLTPPFA